MSLRPLSGRLVIRPDAKPTRAGALHLPDSYTPPGAGETGTVVSVAEDEPTLKPGDRVLYPAHRGFELEYEDQKFLGMLRQDLWAVLP